MRTITVRLTCVAVLAAAAVLVAAAVSGAAGAMRPGAAPAAPSAARGVTRHPGLVTYRADADSRGVMEKVSNIYNTTIVSRDRNVFEAEYEAGFIQGRLQKDQIIAARDNEWDSAYLVDPTHSFPRQLGPTLAELGMAQRTLAANWDYTLDYIRSAEDPAVATGLRRLMYRLVGIYHGASRDRPQKLPFTADWQPAFTSAELSLGYETPDLTFMDLYWVNAYQDVLYLLPDDPVPVEVADGRPSKCSAFLLKKGGEIYLTHNNWNSFLDQSQAVSLWVAGDFIAANMGAPGYLCSDVDFGYTNKGLFFNETTHRWAHSEPKARALWMFWRAALAEQFASSVDEFFRFMALEASGTYMSGYMVADAKTGEMGYIEMSYDAFVFFRLDGEDGVEVTTQPAGLSTEYDTELVTPTYVLGINLPASTLIRDELKAVDNRPQRRVQFLERIGGVHDIASAKALITYTDPTNPLSIYGRWDLGYGITPAPKTIPDGACDAKAVTATMVRTAAKLRGVLDVDAGVRTFWMKYGTPTVNGKPFIWSESQWSGQKLRFVPDRVEGDWRLLHLHMR
jgi:hypothetical protein